jgi:FkbM family methyltransferase
MNTAVTDTAAAATVANALPDWLTVYPHPTEGPLFAVRVGDIVSWNDGDVCNAACTERLLAKGTDEAVASAEKPICVDIGVDHGWWSAFCLNRCPAASLYAFEPNPKSLEALQTKFAAEAAAGRLTLVPKAVSDAVTTIPLVLDGGCSHSRSGIETRPDMPSCTVETTTLDFLFEAHPRIDLMKIDTEGHEYAIFKGLRGKLDRVGAMIFEFSPYWYGETRAECLGRSYEMLEAVFETFPYVYTLSRRGFPKPLLIPSLEVAAELMQSNYNGHAQTDILASRTPL